MPVQYVPCPECRTPIPFDPYGLARGETFACTSCPVRISITPSSQSAVQSALNQFDNLKGQLLKNGKDSGRT